MVERSSPKVVASSNPPPVRELIRRDRVQVWQLSRAATTHSTALGGQVADRISNGRPAHRRHRVVSVESRRPSRCPSVLSASTR